MRFFARILLCTVFALTCRLECIAQPRPQTALSSEKPAPALIVAPACPDPSDPQLEISYFPSSGEATIKNAQSLTLRLVFNNGFTPAGNRTIAFQSQQSGVWKAVVPLVPPGQANYAIWYVRDDSTGQRDDNHGHYWDLVFCDAGGKKLTSGVRNQAIGYQGTIFSDDIKRPPDYDRAIAILEANIDTRDDQSAGLVSAEWTVKFNRLGGAKSAPPELVQEIEKGLSEHRDDVGYIHGTAEFLMSLEKEFPPALVDQAVETANRSVPTLRLKSELDRKRAEDIADPRERAQALEEWLAKYPDDPSSNYVRKERLAIFVNYLDDVGAAEDSFQDLVKRTPGDADLYAAMASVYLRRRAKLDQALAYLGEAEQNLGTGEITGGARITLLANSGDLARQKAILNQLRGYVLFDQQEWQEAESVLQEAAPVLKGQESASTYDLLGQTQEQRQEWAKAKASYREAALRSHSPSSTAKFVEMSLKTGTPSREAALEELAGAQQADFDGAHYKPVLVNLLEPDFTFTTATGEKITAQSLRGQTVVLNLWSTWCGPCLSELTGFAELKRVHPELRVLLAAMDSTVPTIEKEFQAHGLSSEDIVLVDEDNAAKFGTNGVPQTYVIDKEGHIRVVHYGAVGDVPLFLDSDLAAVAQDAR